MGFIFWIGRTVERQRGEWFHRLPPTEVLGPANRGRFVAPGMDSEVWVGCSELTDAQAARLIASGCVLFADLDALVPLASRPKLEAIGVPSELVRKAATVRELLREVARTPDDSFERLESRVLADRIRRDA